ncbi:hypothetical protein [Streptomyces sp. NPDC048581]|uniref:hypothetical protein n=1 Tax=unclassified Streptomyces TaxID=2593676 RepID=UPI00370FE95B
MATNPIRLTLQAGQDWLLSCARNPSAVCRAWAADELARIPSGEYWLVVEGPLLQSIQAMKRVGSQKLGPVLVDGPTSRAWWLLPPGLGNDVGHVPQLTVHPSGWQLACPPVLYAINERTWLERPDGSGRLTDPTALGVAFGRTGRPHAEALG